MVCAAFLFPGRVCRLVIVRFGVGVGRALAALCVYCACE